MYYLSELYGRLGQILAEHGDMPVVRQQCKGLDNLSTDIRDQWIDYENTDILIVKGGRGNKLVIQVPTR